MRRDREDTFSRLFNWITAPFESYSRKTAKKGVFFRRLFKELRASEQRSSVDNERFQLEALRELITHAAHYVPAYTRSFAEKSVYPGLLQTLSDIGRFPLLDRATLFASASKFRAINMHERELTKTLEGYLWQKGYESELAEVFQAMSGGQPFYSSPEKACFAIACKAGLRYHFYPTIGIVELVDEKLQPLHRQGDRGEIVLTGLTNWAMPFIRLRTGDLGTWSARSCADCGRMFPTLDKLRIRMSAHSSSAQSAA